MPKPVEDKKLKKALEKRRDLHFSRLIETDLYYFTKYLLDYHLLEFVPHYNMCKFIQQGDVSYGIPLDFKPQIIIQLIFKFPRGSFKSTIASNSYPLFVLKEHPDWKILLGSSKIENSAGFLNTLKNNAQKPQFIARYGDWRPNKGDGYWSEDMITIAPRVELMRSGKIPAEKEPSIVISGVNSGVASKHVNMAIIDDPHDEENHRTKENINKVIDYLCAIVPLLDPPYKMIIPCTSWTDADAYEHAVSELKFRAVVMSCYKDLKIYDDGKEIYARKGDGHSYFPKRYPDELLEEIKKRTGRMFYAWYMNDPVPEEAQVFSMKYKKVINPQGVPDGCYAGMSVDTNFGEAKASDYQAILVGKRDFEGKIYLAHTKSYKLTPAEFMEEAFRLIKRHNVKVLGCEDITSGKTFLNDFENEMRKRGTYVKIVRIKRGRKQNKEERTEAALAGMWQNGDIIFIKGVDTSNLEHQLIRHPKSKNDDEKDALADLPEILKWGRKPEKKKEFLGFYGNKYTGFMPIYKPQTVYQGNKFTGY